MKLLADENVDRPIVERLRQSGYQVKAIAEIAPGATDEEVLSIALRERAVLLTADKDFGEIVFHQRKTLQGVILIRLSGLPPSQKAEVVAMALERHGAKMEQAFTVITPKAVRVRPWSI